MYTTNKVGNIVFHDIISSVFHAYSFISNRIGGVMVSMFASSAVDRAGIETLTGQTKDYKISICCFSAKQVTVNRKSKDWLARNQDNV